MDLNFTQEYEEFRAEVRGFLENNRDNTHQAGLTALCAVRSVWLGRRFCWRTAMRRARIRKQYGGYGAEPDALKARIIAEEFARAGVPGGMAGQGINMLVPTLLELGTDEQKEKYIKPTLSGEMVWCQGYSEPGAGSDLGLIAHGGGG